jgi:predicted flap endonuclease-1-like 5' DNA nuclease
LFLLASALGFILGHWWSRRNFVDVSESYEDLRKATEQTDAANWEQLWKRLDSLPEPKETDLSPVFERLDGVHNAVGNIPKPDTVDLAPVQSRLESLGGLIGSIPVPVAPKDPDFRPLVDRIEKLESGIHAIPAPTDIGPLSTRLSELETAVRNIPDPAPQQEVDLQPVQNELSSIRGQISGLPKVDLTPIDGRLLSIETEIDRLGKRLSRPGQSSSKSTRAPAPPKRQSGQPTILSAALYGKKDDLKNISGVGPKLERLLNKNGVYYFWQVATWSHSDIDIIDERLDAFKGRISRDDWVSQAEQLRKSPQAASMPSE